ncbi:carbohydrate ABC transporter permease [Cryobacterium sp. TmT2-59]|uniref:Carbohydrate ABC transporter permease n=1 Tax=Cryobacterium shii TaxID=1259235 RepID=A0AAQ2HG19_9MICO|nr:MULTISPECIES: carbohydrate ABC transporter permease [Cryobacterium]TFC50491.1 carbohydrate ABC transporter permease [Cryobacterium shii]TFC82122.1 carbohydrate ABC transporter permease [Cryobacterium sp. TmT2-59]
MIPAIIWAVLILVPLAYLFIIPFRTQQEYSANPLGIPAGLNFENYATAWNQGQLGTAFANTMAVTAVSVAAIIALSSAAAYALSRWRGRAGSRLFTVFALGLIVPFQLGLPTLYKMWAGAGLVDNLPGVILIQIGAGIPLAVFLYYGFLSGVPRELEEAAKIDGASDLRVFTSLVFPLLKPATATVAILSTITVWNDLIVSLYFLQSKANQTLPKATIGFQSTFNNDVPVFFACAVLSLVPVLIAFIALQKFVLSGLTAGALRS